MRLLDQLPPHAVFVEPKSVPFARDARKHVLILQRCDDVVRRQAGLFAYFYSGLVSTLLAPPNQQSNQETVQPLMLIDC